MSKLAWDDIRKGNRKKTSLLGGLYNIAIMFGILIITIVLSETLYNIGIDPQSLTILYALAVLIISIITPTYLYGMAAAAISAFACDYFLSGPKYSFTLTRGSAAVTLITMLVVTVIISTLTVQLKIQARLAIERERRIQLLYEMGQRLISSHDKKETLDVSSGYLAEYLELPVIYYAGDPLSQGENVYSVKGNGEIFFTQEERKRAHRFYRGQHGELDSLDGSEVSKRGVMYFPVISKEAVLGIIGVNCGSTHFQKGKLTFIQMLAAQTALVLELQKLSEEQNRMAVDTEREKMRATLLRSISHDLRAPLTSIAGSSSAILEQRDMDRSTLSELAGDINENSKWLIRMVENILTVTKITSDAMTLVKVPEAAEEVVSQTVSIVRARFPGCNIHVRIPDELLVIPMDATLISQVIINLLENAIKNSREIPLILLDVQKTDAYARFSVSDNGRGIPEHLLENLFEMHSPHTEQAVDALRGMGIGLSICRTIIQAHGGVIEGHNKTDGGARFSFILPLEEVPEHAKQQ